MKQKLYILGLASAMISFAGVILKINHWPGASILLTLGLVMLSWIFIPLALANNYKVEGDSNNRVLYIVTGLISVVVITAMLFKIMHWPFAGLLLTIGLPLPYVLFLPVFIAVTKKNKSFSLNKVVAVMLLLVFQSVFSAMLALNVSYERIAESFNLSKSYSAVSGVFGAAEGKAGNEEISKQIDSLIAIVDDYQTEILRFDDLTLSDWQSGTAVINSPDSRSYTAYVLEQKGAPAGIKLFKAVEKLVQELRAMDKDSELAGITLAVSGIADFPDVNDWSKVHFYENNVAWSMIYLDELRAFLAVSKVAGLK